MRILLVTHFFLPQHNSGTENYTWALARALLERDHHVEVVCAEDWEWGEEYFNSVSHGSFQGLTVHRCHLNWKESSNPNRVLYDSDQVASWFEDFLNSARPDLLHVTSLSSLGLGVLRVARGLGVPTVLTFMDFWFLCPKGSLLRSDGRLCTGITEPSDCSECLLSSSGAFRTTQAVLPAAVHTGIWRRISETANFSRLRGARGMALNLVDRKAQMAEAVRLPDVLISHSSCVKDTISSAGLSQRVTHLPNGHELNHLSDYRGKQSSEVTRFGYIGQIIEIKGVHVLIEAFKRAGLGGKAVLTIWGDLEQNEAYSERIENLIEERTSIRLRGRFERSQLSQVLSEIDVLVVPSLWYENAPLVIHEAFATNTPVIATNLGGMSELITNEVNGLLFEHGNIDDLGLQLRRLVEEPDLLTSLAAGTPSVKTIDEEVTQLEEVYRNLISRRSL